MRKPLLNGTRAGAVFSSLLMLGACANTYSAEAPVSSGNDSLPVFSQERIRADLEFLADDMLEGRDTGSRGYRIAANYVAATFKQLDLKPGGDNGSYFQEVPFQKAKLDLESTNITITNTDGETVLSAGDDFFVSGSVKNPSGSADGEVVFAGYGIQAPELGHDDLADVNVEGKIVLIFNGAPNSFHTEIRAHYGSSATKAAALAKLGAKGVLTVSSASGENRPNFSRFKRFLGRERYDWVLPEGSDSGPQIGLTATVSQSAAEKLFVGSGVTFEDTLQAFKEGKAKNIALKSTVSMSRESILSDEFTSPNVVGILEGSDPKLKSEYVVMSAHLDHIGLNPNAPGDDKINNGALDNASGTSIMMEVARAYVREGVRPKRSIIFAAVTAEEKGLLGAEYFATYPTVAKNKIIGNVNVDMPVLLYDFVDVIAFGSHRSSLGGVVDKAAAKVGIKLIDDPIPEQGIFTRSDHYRFVQQGVPAVFLATGFGVTPDGDNGGDIFRNWLGGGGYHSPRDQADLPINYKAGAKFGLINYLILKDIADADDAPTWNEGDFFGETFGK
jgi:Zn-dependent M28 family amino/carboxypeptidase